MVRDIALHNRIQIINPITYPGWDNLLLTNRESSFFHSSSWAKVLYESYDYQLDYLTIINQNKLFFLIPLMKIKSFLTGQRGVSTPFTDFCDPIIDKDISSHEVLDYLFIFSKRANLKSNEIRGGNNFLHDFTPSSNYYHHTLDLFPDKKKSFQASKEVQKVA